MSNIIAVDDNTFEAEVLSASTPVLVDFYTESCAPCAALKPILERLLGEFSSKIKFAKVNGAACPGLMQKQRVRGFPTMVIYVDGHEESRIVGVKPEQYLKNLLLQCLASQDAAIESPATMFDHLSIHEALQVFEVEAVQAVLERSPHCVEELNENGRRPAEVAVSMLNKEILDVLVSAGANLTPIELAALDRVDALEGILCRNPKLIDRSIFNELYAHLVGGESNQKLTLLNVACLWGATGVAQALLARYGSLSDLSIERQQNLIFHAVIGFNVETMEALFASGLKLYEPVELPIILMAIREEELDVALRIVDLLLANGADPTRQFKGRSMTDIAKESGLEPLADELSKRISQYSNSRSGS